MTIAQTILDQLGGNKFMAMTGSKNFTDCGRSLSMRLAKNASRANYLKITLNGLDTYDMEFTQYLSQICKYVKKYSGNYSVLEPGTYSIMSPGWQLK